MYMQCIQIYVTNVVSLNRKEIRIRDRKLDRNASRGKRKQNREREGGQDRERGKEIGKKCMQGKEKIKQWRRMSREEGKIQIKTGIGMREGMEG